MSVFSDYWGDGSIEREFEESGLECCTRTVDFGHRCGYEAKPCRAHNYCPNCGRKVER